MAKKASKVRTRNKKLDWPVEERRNTAHLKVHRFIGISLGGGKSDRTSIVVLEYYIGQKKLVINRVIDRLKTEGDLSADLRLHEHVNQFKSDVELIALDVPLSLPKCFRCQLSCPGYEVCNEDEIVWMWKHQKQEENRKKSTRLFTPYTRRCAEAYWSNELGEDQWSIGDCLGANQAPLMARGRFITRRWEYNSIEVIPRLSLSRWMNKERLSRLHLKAHRHSVGGVDSRDYILKHAIDRLNIFIYDQDKQILTENLVAFDSLWAALTAFWKFGKICENRPKGFPRSEGWIEVPQF